MKKSNYFLTLICFILSLSIVGVDALAKDDDALGFSVKQLPSSKQIDTEYGFYYLKTRPDEEQNVEVMITSTRKEPVEVTIDSLNAFSGSKGTIHYKKPDEKEPELRLDKSLKHSFVDLVSSEDTVSVENFESKTVRVNITPPKDSYEGVIMGSLFFSSSNDTVKSPVGVKQGYEIGVILSESGEEFTNGSNLKLLSVKPALVRSQRMVLANIQNPEPVVLQNANLNTVIKEKKTGKIIKEKKFTGLTLAPNTNTNIEFEWGLAQLPSGTFTFELKGNNEFDEWFFTKDFNISKKEAQKINDQSAFEIKTPGWIKLFAIFNGVLVVGVVAYLGIRRKKFEKLWTIEKASKRKKRERGRKKRTK